MTTIIKYRATFLIGWFTLLSGLCFAQTEHRLLTFKKGELYEKTTRINSSVILKRYDQTYAINSSSSITNNYSIANSTDAGFTVAVTTKRIIDTLSAMGTSMKYDSNKPIDTTSLIQKRLNTLIQKTANVSLGKRDTIVSINNPDLQLVNDTLLAFAGLPSPLVEGGRLGLTVDYPNFATQKKGFTWEKSNSKMGLTSKFKIKSRDSRTTTITFESNVRQPGSNSNTNGILVAENDSGIILECQMRTTKIDQQIFNKVLYTASRSIAISETCTRKK